MIFFYLPKYSEINFYLFKIKLFCPRFFYIKKSNVILALISYQFAVEISNKLSPFNYILIL
jgi:hypothetical protein